MATGEDHPDIADVRMHLRTIRMFCGLEKGQRISFSQFVRHAEQNAGGCPTGDGRLSPINRACYPHRKYQRISTVSPTFSRYARSARIAKVSTQYHSPNTNTSVSV